MDRKKPMRYEISWTFNGSQLEHPATWRATRNPSTFLPLGPVHAPVSPAYLLAPLIRRTRACTRVSRSLPIAESGSRMGNWNGFILRRKTRFFSGGETADFSFDRFTVSRLGACKCSYIYIGCFVINGTRE